MRVAQLMSSPPITCCAKDSLNAAARLMWEHDCGTIPIVDDDGRIVGIVTDRDICMAAYTRGERLNSIPVTTAMAKSVFSCHPDDTIEKVEAVMGEQQIRRLPVVDAENRPLGLISLNDLAQEMARPRSIGNGLQRAFLTALGAICGPRSSELAASTPNSVPAVRPTVEMAATAG